MVADYEKTIRQLSFAYDKKGRVGHDQLLDSLKGEIEEFPYQILRKIVLEDYLERRGPSNRLFGPFPEWDIRDLTLRCNNLENSSNIPLQ